MAGADARHWRTGAKHHAAGAAVQRPPRRKSGAGAGRVAKVVGVIRAVQRAEYSQAGEQTSLRHRLFA